MTELEQYGLLLNAKPGADLCRAVESMGLDALQAKFGFERAGLLFEYWCRWCDAGCPEDL